VLSGRKHGKNMKVLRLTNCYSGDFIWILNPVNIAFNSFMDSKMQCGTNIRPFGSDYGETVRETPEQILNLLEDLR
jgi:hypothetical protein